MGFYIQEKRLLINDKVYPDFEIEREIGSGANGHVFLAKNLLLDRIEAIKIWNKNREDDKRDKTKQALFESQKLARVDPQYAVQIFNIENFEGYIVAHMEYFEGKTLHEFINDLSAKKTFYLLRQYLHVIEKTSSLSTFHGDAHARNVLIKVVTEDYETKVVLKLCDFGTSYFNGKESSFDRHWRVVEETILKYTKRFIGFEDAKDLLNEYKNILNENVLESKEKLFQGDDSLYDPRLITAPYKDFLEYLEYRNGCIDYLK